MYYKHRYNLIRFDLSTSGTAYKLFIKSLYDYVIVKEVTVSDVTVRSYFIGAKDLEANWTNKASLTYSTDTKGRKLLNEGQNWLLAAVGQYGERGAFVGEVKASPQYRTQWLNLDGSTVNVEDYPLLWIEETYYNTYKDDTFVLPINAGNEIWAGDAIDYDAVTDIDLSNQSLTTDFTFLDRYSNLVILYLQGNSISNLDLSNFNTLNYVNCTNNNVSILDVTSHIGISSIYCGGNNISILDVENLTELRFLHCYLNSISVLNITNLNKLVQVHCAVNNISILDVENKTLLSFLDCANNNISVLNVTNLVNLTGLFCQYNNISVLNTTNLVNVTAVYCYNNNITTLNASGLISCTNLRCYNNELDAAANSQILIDLDTNGLSNGYLHSSIFGGGSLTAAGQTAKINLLSKGWTIVGI